MIEISIASKQTERNEWDKSEAGCQLKSLASKRRQLNKLLLDISDGESNDNLQQLLIDAESEEDELNKMFGELMFAKEEPSNDMILKMGTLQEHIKNIEARKECKAESNEIAAKEANMKKGRKASFIGPRSAQRSGAQTERCLSVM